MSFLEKIEALIKIIQKLLEKLKRKLNSIKKKVKYVEIVKHIKANQDNLLILCEAAKNIDDFRKGCSESDLKNLFSNIKNEIKNAQNVL